MHACMHMHCWTCIYVQLELQLESWKYTEHTQSAHACMYSWNCIVGTCMVWRRQGKKKQRRPVRQPVWLVQRPVWPVHPVSLEILPRPRTKQGRALKSLWPNMRRKEPPRSRRDGQTKLKIQSHRSSITCNRILKVIMLLCHVHLTDRLLHGFGRILIVIHL